MCVKCVFDMLRVINLKVILPLEEVITIYDL